MGKEMEGLLGFGDLVNMVDRLKPAIVNQQTLNFLYYARVTGLVLSIVLFLCWIFFKIKIKPLKPKKEVKIGKSSLNKDSLLNEDKFKLVLIKMDEYLKFDNILYWKLALAEIESYFNKVLLEVGFRGNDLTGKLCNVSDSFLPSVEQIRQTHMKVTEILNDNNYLLTKDEVSKILDVYKMAIDELRKM